MKLLCPRCKNEFYKRDASALKNKSGIVYCSRDCRFQDRRVSRVCPTCKKDFSVIKSWTGTKQNYCSVACANVGFRKPKISMSCAFCEKEVLRYPSDIKKMNKRGYRHVFCSHKCRAAMIAAQFDPPRPYLGKHTSAPRNGTQMIKWRKSVIERDEFACQDCGAKDLVLCAHHIKAYALYPDLRYDVDNGVTLCYPCHEKRHSLASSQSHQSSSVS